MQNFFLFIILSFIRFCIFSLQFDVLFMEFYLKNALWFIPLIYTVHINAKNSEFNIILKGKYNINKNIY